MNAGRFRKRRFGSSSFVIAVTAACVSLSLPGVGQGREGVTPEKRDVFLWPHGKDDFVLRVDLSNPPPSREPVDVLFLFDTTASMANIIGAVQDAARDIMLAIRHMSSNTQFAVASFGDYPPHGYPWRLDQDFTVDIDLAQRALTGLSQVDGGDIPEAYSRALYESQFLSWRPDARRFVILFGDAPAHDPEFYGRDYGIDPGRDGNPGTPDDLRLGDVVTELARKGITIIPLYDSTRGPANKVLWKDAVKGFAFMAKHSGGLMKPVSSASEAPRAIAAGIREVYRPKPAVLVPEAYRSWATVSDAKATSYTYRTFAFDVALHPPTGTTSGVYSFPLTAVYAGIEGDGEIGRTDVTIRIGVANYPWRRLLFPFYGLFLVAFFGPRVVSWVRQKITRYEHNGLYWAVLWRVVAAVLLFLVIYRLWAQGHDDPINLSLFGMSLLSYGEKANWTNWKARR